MTLAFKFTTTYVSVALVWIFGLKWLSAAVPAAAVARLSLYEGWAFLSVSAVLLYIMLSREMARRDSIERDLRALAIRDPMTGLLNRACFTAYLDKAIAFAQRRGRKVGVAFIDLDGFKAVNDRLGHQAGDCLLAEIGRRIGNVIRASDTAARLGGDEFAVLVQGERGMDMDRLGERLTEALRAPAFIEGQEIRITASIGFAFFPDHGLCGADILRAADRAMYQVKAGGKDGVRAAETIHTAACAA